MQSCKGSSRPSYTISVCANRRDRKFPIRYRQCYCGNPCCYHNAISHLSDGDGNARTLAFIQNFLPSIKSSDEQEQRLHLAASSAWHRSNWELKAIGGVKCNIQINQNAELSFINQHNHVTLASWLFGCRKGP